MKSWKAGRVEKLGKLFPTFPPLRMASFLFPFPFFTFSFSFFFSIWSSISSSCSFRIPFYIFIISIRISLFPRAHVCIVHFQFTKAKKNKEKYLPCVLLPYAGECVVSKTASSVLHSGPRAVVRVLPNGEAFLPGLRVGRLIFLYIFIIRFISNVQYVTVMFLSSCCRARLNV